MKRSRLLVFVAAVFVANLVLQFAPFRGKPDASPAPAAARQTQAAGDVSAGPGLVEAVSEEIRVSSQIGGRLDRVLVDEGDRVNAGDVLAIIDNCDFRARVASAEAELRLRHAEHRRLINGARPQERQEAAAAVAEADAVLQHTLIERTRHQALFAAGASPRANGSHSSTPMRAKRIARAPKPKSTWHGHASTRRACSTTKRSSARRSPA